LTVTNRTRPVRDMNRDEIRGALALRAITRLTVDCRTQTIEDHLEAKVRVHDATLRSGETCEDALALAAQVLDCFKQIAAPYQESRI
jgi:hypothetical protein